MTSPRDWTAEAMPHPLVVLMGQAHVLVGELGLIEQLAHLLALRADPLRPRNQPRPPGKLHPGLLTELAA